MGKLVKFQKEKVKNGGFDRPVLAGDFVLIYNDGHGKVELLSIESNLLTFDSKDSAASWASWFKEDAFINLRPIEMRELMPNYFKDGTPTYKILSHQ